MRTRPPVRLRESVVAATLGSLLCLATAPLAAAPAPRPLAGVEAAAYQVTFQPQIPYSQVRVTVTGPDGFEVVESFDADETPAVVLPGADGFYKYELRFSPPLDDAARDRAAARGAGADLGGSKATDRRTVQRGWFSLAGGSVVPERVEPEPKVVLTSADGVIRNSSCVGFDCPNSPVFDDSTILMMENNTRIKFGDTSNSPFPNNDWEIEANSSLSGGASYLGFNDCGTADNDGGCATDLVFAVEAGARQSALHVESDGDVGIGTSNPVLDLHIVTGNTPALRLDQDGSSGFTSQVWDIAGNETNFFVRDVTAGSRLPLRIRPGAPTSAIDIAASGNVGVGTSSPSEAVHVLRTNAAATLVRIENANAAGQSTGVQLRNSALTAASTTWSSQVASNGNFQFTESGTGGAEFEIVDGTVTGNSQKFRFGANNGGGFQTLMEILANGNVNSLSGIFGMTSDRNAKTDIVPVDPREVLARVSAMPISTWRYKHNSDELHMGPMAQDFWAAFGLHEGPTSIALNDLAGVALGAIQGLTQELDERFARLEALLLSQCSE